MTDRHQIFIKNMYKNVYSNITHNRPAMETLQISINYRTDTILHYNHIMKYYIMTEQMTTTVKYGYFTRTWHQMNKARDKKHVLYDGIIQCLDKGKHSL